MGNLLEFEEKNKKGTEGLAPTASVKVGGIKGDIQVQLNVDAGGDQKYLWFTDAATRQVIKAKIVGLQGPRLLQRPPPPWHHGHPDAVLEGERRDRGRAAACRAAVNMPSKEGRRDVQRHGA